MYTEANIFGHVSGHASNNSVQDSHSLYRLRARGTPLNCQVNGVSRYSSHDRINRNPSHRVPFTGVGVSSESRRTPFQLQQQLSHELLPLSSSSFNRYEVSRLPNAMTTLSDDRRNLLSRECRVNVNSSPYTSIFQSTPPIQANNHTAAVAINHRTHHHHQRHRQHASSSSPLLQSQMSLRNNVQEPSTVSTGPPPPPPPPPLDEAPFISTSALNTVRTSDNESSQYARTQVCTESSTVVDTNANYSIHSSPIASVSSFILITIALIIIGFIVLSPVLHYVM